MTTLCSLMLSMGFLSCIDDDNEPELVIDPVEKLTFILNEGAGLSGANNANITSFISKPGYEIKDLSDIYEINNDQKMGDLAKAMIEEDDKVYVVLNGSKYVARLNLSMKEEARYNFSKDEGAPSSIDVEDDYAYIAQYGGQVSKLNIKDMTLVATFKGGDNLEGIVEKEGKLYVANTWKSANEFNKEIIVIDAKTMTQTGSIDVVLNPEKVKEINDKIYVISRGNYFDVHASLQVIDTKTSTSKEILKDVTKITKGLNGLIYGVCSTYDENWNSVNSFFTYNPNNNTVSETSFLKDAPSALYSTAIYLLEVDEKNGYIYVGTSDYITNGTIYQFDQTGKLIRQFDSGGINPSAMIFID